MEKIEPGNNEEAIKKCEEEVRKKAGFKRRELREGYEAWKVVGDDEPVKQIFASFLPIQLRDNKIVMETLDEELKTNIIKTLTDYELKTSKAKYGQEIIESVKEDFNYLKEETGGGGVSYEHFFNGCGSIGDLIKVLDNQIANIEGDIGSIMNLLIEIKLDEEMMRDYTKDALILTVCVYKLKSLITILQSKNI